MASHKAEYRRVGRDYIKNYRTQEGVQETPCGLPYRVIEQGDGPVPNEGSYVQVYYRGTFVDGTEFDSNMDEQVPMAIRIREVIEGWKIILQHMPQGSTYEVVIPYELAYGTKNSPGIKAFSTLIFTIKLTMVA